MCAGSTCHIAVVVSNKYSIARNLYQLDVSLPIQYHSTTCLSSEFSKAMLCCGRSDVECFNLALKLLGIEVAWSAANAGLQAAVNSGASGNQPAPMGNSDLFSLIPFPNS